MAKALIIVDMQWDFIRGALAVKGADELELPLHKRMDDYSIIVATQDWHPQNHVSFKTWPEHCVQGSRGAELIIPREQRVSLFLRKGTDQRVDSYSAFKDNPGPNGERRPTGLTGYLKERGVTEVVVCGLARDFCCLWTAKDAAEQGFHTRVIWPLTRAVYPEKDDETRQAYREADVLIEDK